MKEEKLVVEIVNRKARHEYFFHSKIEAGIALTGTEIKSIRNGKVNFTDAYCRIADNELYVYAMHIAEYKFGTYNNHEPKRQRKLLVHKHELKKLNKRVQEKGFTIVPYRLYINERGFAKLEIALAQGKKSYDKRDSIKAKDNKRALERSMRDRY